MQPKIIAVAGHSAQAYLRINFANMQMTVFQAIRLKEESFGLSSPLALCSQCGALYLAMSHITAFRSLKSESLHLHICDKIANAQCAGTAYCEFYSQLQCALHRVLPAHDVERCSNLDA